MTHLKYIALLACLLGGSLGLPAAQAGAGHDHGETPAAASAAPLPTVTAVSEDFELVGRLGEDELTILIDRHASNEPVLAASLTVEASGRSAPAPFHAEHGDYALSDPALLAQLRQPGSKPLTFTLVAGAESDLLTGDLDVHEDHAEAAGAAPTDWRTYALGAGGGLAGLALLSLLLRRLRATRATLPGGAA